MENDQELGKRLSTLEEHSRQQLKYTRLQCLFSLISLVCCVIVVILVFTALPRVEAMVGQAELILGNLETATRELANMDVTSLVQQMQSLLTNVDSLVSNVDTLVSTNQDGLVETLYPEGAVLKNKSVLSFTPALCASMQVALCVKLLTGRPVETGKLYYFDLLNQEFESIPMA